MKHASTLKTAPHTLSPRQRGSLIILVVVVLVLVTVAAIVYLQVARSDRAAVDRMHQSNIDQVIQSTVAHIQQVLLDDLVDENGDFLVPGRGQSVYDYPWTNPANPGTGDNRHLASTRPEQIGGQLMWRHVTNLMGDRINRTSGAITEIQPDQTNQALPAALNADADGDGTNDSLFQPAPVFQIGDIQYTIAPRIVDLSSMINLNVAGSLNGANPARVRGYYPTDVDLARFFSRIAAPEADWQAVLNERGMTAWTEDGVTDVDPSNNPLAGSRAHNWFTQARIWDHQKQTFDLYEEFALRSRSLDLARRPRTTSRLESLMPLALDAPTPNQFTTFSGHSPIMIRWTGTTFPRPWPALGTPNAAGQPTQRKVDQFDLNAQFSGDPGERIPMLMRMFRSVFEAGNNPYQGMAFDQIEIAAIEAALAVDAYSSSDPAIRSINYTDSDPQVRYFGLKPLPFIREVYLQWAYEDRLESVDPGTGDPPEELYTHWLRNNDSFAMAIELGNPFDEPINVGLAERPVRIRVVYDGNETAVVNLGGLGFTNGTGTLPPQGAPLIVYSNPSAVFLEDGQGGNLANDLGFAARHRAMLPSGTLRLQGLPQQGNLNLQNVVVELQTRQSTGGPWITYDRFFFRSADDPAAVLVEEPVGADPAPGAIRHDRNRADPSHRHMQIAVARDGENARFLSNRGRDLTLQRDLPTSAGDPAFQTSVSLGQEVKTAQAGGNITGDVFLDNHPVLIAGRPIQSVAELGWIMLRGFTNEEFGDLPQRLSGSDGGAGFLSSPTGQRRLFLDIRPGVPRTDITNIGAIPHAAILMNMFTTLHPQFDGADNNGSGTVDDPSERLIRGTINVNTTSRDVLLSLPIMENLASREALIDAIITYRDNPGSRGGIRADSPGIASVGELLFVNPEADGDAANMQAYAQVDPGLAPGDPMRLYPMPEQTNKVALDSPGTTPQDRLARFQMLSQILTTRSDLYAAWVLVEGYRAGAWDEGPVESARFIAIFDRSEVRTTTDQVRVLGVFRVE